MVIPHAGLTVRDGDGTCAPANPYPRRAPVHNASSAAPKKGNRADVSALVSSTGLAAGTTAKTSGASRATAAALVAASVGRSVPR